MGAVSGGGNGCGQSKTHEGGWGRGEGGGESDRSVMDEQLTHMHVCCSFVSLLPFYRKMN
jgi:hypothetical protein